MNISNSAKTVFPDAVWVWSHSSERDDRDRRVHFRRTFELEQVPDSAEIKVTADAYYTLWVNGQYVNRGPARGFQTHYPFDRLDLAPYLKTGRNVLAVLVYQYGISNYSYSHQWASGFLLSGRIGSLNLGTGTAWKFREAPGYLRGIARASGQYCFQEFFDCRAGDGDWQQPDYSDTEWDAVGPGEQRAVGCMPWHSFEERGIPLLTRDLIKPEKLVGVSHHEPAPDWRAPQNVGYIYRQEEPDWQGKSEPADIVEFEPGLTAQLIDFGKEVVGHLQLEINNAQDGEILDLMVCESRHGSTPDFDLSGKLFLLFGGRITLKNGSNKHEFTMPWGFRYLVLLRRDASRIRVKSSVRQTVYPLEVTGNLQSSDKRLQDIWRISERAQRCCMVDAYIDCPWRENAQWWGDALVQVKNTFRLSNDIRLFERGLRLIAAQQTPNGLTYAMAPTCGHTCILPDYSAMWIVTLFAHYWQTGTPALWLELRDIADDILNYFQDQIADDGLLYFDDRYWLFLDWCPKLHKNGAPATLNLIYLWALQSARKLAVVTGDSVRNERYSAAIEQMEEALVRNLYNDKTQLLHDGLTFDGERVQTTAPHTVALAMLVDLLPDAHDVWLEQILLPLLHGTRTEELLPSSYFMYYIFEAVKAKGYRADVLDCVRRWWGEFVEHDCSTTPENWPEKLLPGRWSWCHAWSAHPLVHFSEILLGVRQTAPGWRQIAFEPLMVRGEKAAGTVPTPFGQIEVKWDWTGPEPVKSIQLPDGIQLDA